MSDEHGKNSLEQGMTSRGRVDPQIYLKVLVGFVWQF